MDKISERADRHETQVMRLQDPSRHCTTFSGLKKLQNSELAEQLKIRKVVDHRTESSGKPLICTPPSSGGRSWMVLKLQGLLMLEFKAKKIQRNPNDLEPGDLGCDSRAPRKQRAKNTSGASHVLTYHVRALSCVHSNAITTTLLYRCKGWRVKGQERSQTVATGLGVG